MTKEELKLRRRKEKDLILQYFNENYNPSKSIILEGETIQFSLYSILWIKIFSKTENERKYILLVRHNILNMYFYTQLRILSENSCNDLKDLSISSVNSEASDIDEIELHFGRYSNTYNVYYSDKELNSFRSRFIEFIKDKELDNFLFIGIDRLKIWNDRTNLTKHQFTNLGNPIYSEDKDWLITSNDKYDYRLTKSGNKIWKVNKSINTLINTFSVYYWIKTDRFIYKRINSDLSEEEYRERFFTLFGLEYSIISIDMITKEATIRHNVCGQIFKHNIDNFLTNDEARCIVCKNIFDDNVQEIYGKEIIEAIIVDANLHDIETRLNYSDIEVFKEVKYLYGYVKTTNFLAKVTCKRCNQSKIIEFTKLRSYLRNNCKCSREKIKSMKEILMDFKLEQSKSEKVQAFRDYKLRKSEKKKKVNLLKVKLTDVKKFKMYRTTSSGVGYYAYEMKGRNYFGYSYGPHFSYRSHNLMDDKQFIERYVRPEINEEYIRLYENSERKRRYNELEHQIIEACRDKYDVNFDTLLSMEDAVCTFYCTECEKSFTMSPKEFLSFIKKYNKGCPNCNIYYKVDRKLKSNSQEIFENSLYKRPREKHITFSTQIGVDKSIKDLTDEEFSKYFLEV